MKTSAEIQAWLTDKIAEILSLPREEIDVEATFDSFGLVSRDAVSLSGDLEDFLGRRLSPTLLYEYPSIAELSAHLATTNAGAPRARINTTGRIHEGLQKGSSDAAESKPPAIPLTPEAVEAMSEEEAKEALMKRLLKYDE